MHEVFAQRIAKEKRSAFLQGWFINFVLTYYLVFSLSYLFVDKLELNLGAIGALLQSWPALVLSLMVSLAWSRSANSFGRWVSVRTNAILKQQVESKAPRQWLCSPSGLVCLAALFMTFVVGWQVTEISIRELTDLRGIQGAQRIFAALIDPETRIIEIVLAAMVETIFIALMATALAVPVAFVASFLMARNLMKFSKTSVFVYSALRFFSNFTRSVEPLIWAIIFSVWVGIGPFAGMLALMVHSVAALTKLYSEQIENIDKGPMEAIEATGANRIQVVWYAVVPQIVLPYLSFTIYRWDINIRMATIIGLVGGGGVGTLLMQYQGIAKWNEVGTIILVIAAVVWVMDYLSARIREAIY